jgi:hypothetical protein
LNNEWNTEVNNYLGEFTVNIQTHAVYKNYTSADWALYFIAHYGQIDGDHHKTWVLDQVARILKGTPVIVKTVKWGSGYEEDRVELGEPSQAYKDWVEEMKGSTDEDGSREYNYDDGIAP